MNRTLKKIAAKATKIHGVKIHTDWSKKKCLNVSFNQNKKDEKD